MPLLPVPPERSFRLLNHGPTVIVSAKHGGIENAMSASWVCPLDFSPARVTAVLDKAAYTRGLIEKSGMFALQVPFASQAQTVIALGESYRQNPAKLAASSAELFYTEGFDVPLIKGCAAYLICRLIPEPRNQETYDLFIGEVVGAWADDRVFRDGHWLFDGVEDALKTLHYVSGGQFYLTGKGLKINGVS